MLPCEGSGLDVCDYKCPLSLCLPGLSCSLRMTPLLVRIIADFCFRGRSNLLSLRDGGAGIDSAAFRCGPIYLPLFQTQFSFSVDLRCEAPTRVMSREKKWSNRTTVFSPSCCRGLSVCRRLDDAEVLDRLKPRAPCNDTQQLQAELLA